MFDWVIFWSVLAALLVFRLSEYFARALFVERREWAVEATAQTVGAIIFFTLLGLLFAWVFKKHGLS